MDIDSLCAESAALLLQYEMETCDDFAPFFEALDLEWQKILKLLQQAK